MMLGRIIGIMLQCVKKKENFFMSFRLKIFFFCFIALNRHQRQII